MKKMILMCLVVFGILQIMKSEELKGDNSSIKGKDPNQKMWNALFTLELLASSNDFHTIPPNEAKRALEKIRKAIHEGANLELIQKRAPHKVIKKLNLEVPIELRERDEPIR